MIQVRRTYRFCASHRLFRSDWSPAENERVFGPASNLGGHGHNYRLTLILGGTVDSGTQRLVDLAMLDRLVEDQILKPFDHRNLNVDVPEFHGRVPTAESIARVIWDRLAERITPARLVEVSLQQDEFFTAVYRADG